MKFSIITPSYNQGRFIRDCLQSVKEQACPGLEIEHLVMDACSMDETPGILAQWSSQQHTVPGYTFAFVSEPDRGQTDAINKGFRQATGDWLMWLNADDYLLPGAIKQIEHQAELQSSAEVIFGDCLFVREDKSLLRAKREFGFSFPMLLFYGCYIQSTACFYHRRIFERGLWLDDSMKICMDYDWYMRLALEGCQFIHIPQTLAGFRWHGANASAKYMERRLQERLLIQERALKRLGWGWLARPWILSFAFRAYQGVRLLSRLTRRENSTAVDKRDRN